MLGKFRFSLLTLFTVLTVCAVFSWFWAKYVSGRQAERALSKARDTYRSSEAFRMEFHGKEPIRKGYLVPGGKESGQLMLDGPTLTKEAMEAIKADKSITHLLINDWVNVEALPALRNEYEWHPAKPFRLFERWTNWRRRSTQAPRPPTTATTPQFLADLKALCKSEGCWRDEEKREEGLVWHISGMLTLQVVQDIVAARQVKAVYVWGGGVTEHVAELQEDFDLVGPYYEPSIFLRRGVPVDIPKATMP
ncbi:MAG: hypothetical protein U0836_21055 [Pirellulales bacterium]